MFKKLLPCLLVLFFLFSATGCGKATKSKSETLEKVPFDEVGLYSVVYGNNYYNWKAETFLRIVKKNVP